MTVDTAWTPPGQRSWPSRRPVRSDVMMGCEFGSRDVIGCRPLCFENNYESNHTINIRKGKRNLPEMQKEFEQFLKERGRNLLNPFAAPHRTRRV